MKTIVISLLAVAASAQYTITDMLEHKGPSKTSSSQPATDSSVSPFSSPAAPRDPMAALLTAAEGHPMQTQNGNPTSGQALSQDGIAVVSGLVESFMHKVSLQPGEKACLESNIDSLTGDIMGTVGDIVTTVKALIAGKGTLKKGATGSVVSAGIDSAMKITALIASSTQLIKTCVHGDALDLLKKTSQHLINGTYLSHEFLVNGVDIAHYLADSVSAFEKKDFHRFGSDIGTSLRKILLSKNTNATRLPEGVPDQIIIQKATDGLMRGFFVSGSALTITDTSQPEVDIAVDLHKCIAGNSAFFKELWLAAWNLIAQLSLNGHQHGLGVNQTQGQPQWEGELMVAMMQFPTALTKCGVSQDVQTMFMDALKSLQDIKVQFKLPTEHFHAIDATERMAKAIEAWTNFNFEAFGYELGKLLRELVVLAFPHKYKSDASGRLVKYSQFRTVYAADKKMSTATAATAIIGGAAASLLVAFAAVRVRRSLPNVRGNHEAVASEFEVDKILVVDESNMEE